MQPRQHHSMQRPQPWSRAPRLALAWFNSCLHCHSSFRDVEECLASLIGIAEIVYRPEMNVDDYPENVDLALIEGGVASARDIELAQRIRGRSWKVVAFGDCAIVGAKKNSCGLTRFSDSTGRNASERTIARDAGSHGGSGEFAPETNRIRPLHQVIQTDYSLPGCPPSFDLTFHVIGALLSGRSPSLNSSSVSV